MNLYRVGSIPTLAAVALYSMAAVALYSMAVMAAEKGMWPFDPARPRDAAAIKLCADGHHGDAFPLLHLIPPI